MPISLSPQQAFRPTYGETFADSFQKGIAQRQSADQAGRELLLRQAEIANQRDANAALANYYEGIVQNSARSNELTGERNQQLARQHESTLVPAPFVGQSSPLPDGAYASPDLTGGAGPMRARPRLMGAAAANVMIELEKMRREKSNEVTATVLGQPTTLTPGQAVQLDVANKYGAANRGKATRSDLPDIVRGALTTYGKLGGLRKRKEALEQGGPIGRTGSVADAYQKVKGDILEAEAAFNEAAAAYGMKPEDFQLEMDAYRAGRIDEIQLHERLRRAGQ